jgi:hypothetical protein
MRKVLAKKTGGTNKQNVYRADHKEIMAATAEENSSYKKLGFEIVKMATGVLKKKFWPGREAKQLKCLPGR